MTLRGILLGVVVAAAAAVFGWSLFSALERWLETPPAAAEIETDTAPIPGAMPPPAGDAVARIQATLFFASADGLGLEGVEHEVPLAPSAEDQIRAILGAQLAARPEPPLLSTIPEGVTLRGVYISERKEAFVDLDGTFSTAHPGGSMYELLSVYTIVNAVTVNMPGISGVQILIDGREVDTLAGHVDLRRPLARQDGMIRE
jgi:spore germination protein GerM